jgi:hypothetical protein
MAPGPYSTRRDVWTEINRLLGGSYVSWRYFDQLCGRGKGPTVALRYGRKCLYAPSAAHEWIAAYLRPGYTPAA